MVIDDDVDAVAGGQRVVAGLRLGVDQANHAVGREVDLLDGRVVEAEDADHGAVLRPADDAAARDEVLFGFYRVSLLTLAIR
ncbi:MAG: hypothetical protein QM813_14435, partial [Verrucomicrobiota bacterium]